MQSVGGEKKREKERAGLIKLLLSSTSWKEKGFIPKAAVTGWPSTG